MLGIFRQKNLSYFERGKEAEAKQNLAEAYRLWKEGAARGEVNCAKMLSNYSFFFDGPGPFETHEELYGFLEHFANLTGDTFFIENLISFHETSDISRLGEERIFPYRLHMAQQGNEKAIRKVIDAYFFGIGTQQNKAEGLRWLEYLSTISPDIDDLFEESSFSEERLLGIGAMRLGERDVAFAHWFKGVDKGDHECIALLADYYSPFHTISPAPFKNHEEAFRYFASHFDDHKRAKLYVALAYIRGFGVERNLEKALEIHRDYQEELQQYHTLAEMYARGVGTEISREQAKYYYAKLLEVYGEDERELIEQDLDYLEHASDEFLTALRYAWIGERDQFIEHLVACAEKGCPYSKKLMENEGIVVLSADSSVEDLEREIPHMPAEALTLLEIKYYEGRGIPKDRVMATQLLIQLCEMGDERSWLTLAFRYLLAIGIPQSKEKACEMAERYKTSSLEEKNWDRVAQFENMLANLPDDLLLALGEVDGDREATAAVYGRGAERGILYCIEMASRLGVEWDKEKMLQVLEQRGAYGNIPAMKMLSRLYHVGEAVEENQERAFYWFKKAAEAGSEEDLFEVAFRYMTGLGVAQSSDEARVWLNRYEHADLPDKNRERIDRYKDWLDNASVEFLIAMGLTWAGKAGKAYKYLCQGVAKKDPYCIEEQKHHTFTLTPIELDEEMLLNQANDGNLDAMRVLAFAYLEGRKLPQNLETAHSLFEKLKEHEEFRWVIKELGLYYLLGLYIERDRELARHYLQRYLDIVRDDPSVDEANEYLRWAEEAGDEFLNAEKIWVLASTSGEIKDGLIVDEQQAQEHITVLKMGAQKGDMFCARRILEKVRKADEQDCLDRLFPNRRELQEFLRRYAKEGGIWFAKFLSDKYFDGTLIPDDYSEFFNLMVLLAERYGMLFAIRNVIVFYLIGFGVEQDVNKARAMIAENEHVFTEESGDSGLQGVKNLMNTSPTYLNTRKLLEELTFDRIWGVSEADLIIKERKVAEKLVEGAKQGDSSSGEHLLNDFYEAKEKSKACYPFLTAEEMLEILKLFAEKGSVQFMVYTTELYRSGKLKEIDYGDLFRWELALLENGTLPSLHLILHVARAYLLGFGVEQSKEKALYWLNQYDGILCNGKPFEGLDRQTSGLYRSWLDIESENFFAIQRLILESELDGVSKGNVFLNKKLAAQYKEVLARALAQKDNDCADLILKYVKIFGTRILFKTKAEYLDFIRFYAEKDMEAFINELGDMYLQRRLKINSPEEFFYWMMKAAKHNNVVAALLISQFYVTGFGVERSRDEGLKWLDQCKRLDTKRRYTAKIQRYSNWAKNAKDVFLTSESMWWELYYKGLIVNDDIVSTQERRQYIEILKEGVRQGDMFSAHRLLEWYQSLKEKGLENGIFADKQELLDFLKPHADAKAPRFMSALLSGYLNREVSTDNPEEVFTLAYELNDVKGMQTSILLAKCYLLGWGVERSRECARMHLEEFSKRNFKEKNEQLNVYNRLSELLEKASDYYLDAKRIFDEFDFFHGPGILDLAREKQCLFALYSGASIGDIYCGRELLRIQKEFRQNRTTSQYWNVEETFKYIKFFAEQGHLDFMAELSNMYAGGFGTPVDHEKAFYWQLKVAESGVSGFYKVVGFRYLEGKGVSPSVERAKYWLERALEASEDEQEKAGIKQILDRY